MAFDLIAKLKLIDNMSAPLRKVERQISNVDHATKSYQSTNDRLSASQRRVSRATSGATSSFGGFGKSLDSVSRKSGEAVTDFGKSTAKWTAFSAAAAGAVAVYETIDISKTALSLASDAEQAGIAFETMIGDATKAQKFIGEMVDFAAKTPFDLPGVRDAAKRMLAFGFNLERVLPMLTAVGNASSGLGLGSDGINRITLALGQMKAKAKVSGDEMLQLTEAGIPAWQILADKMKISTAEVMKLSEKGLIPADKAINVLIDGMNKKFPNMMEKQSESLQGLYNNLKETFENKLLVEWGNGIGRALKPRFKQISDWIDDNQSKIKQWGDAIGRAASYASEVILRKFEKAFSYVKDRYINNPEFRNLSAEGKVNFVIADVLRLFNDWLSGEGGKQVTEVTRKLTSTISNGLSDNKDMIKGAASKLGTTLGEGIYEGLQKAMADNPVLTMALGGVAGSRFGLPGIAVGVVGGATASFSSAVDQTKKANGGVLPNIFDFSKNKERSTSVSSSIDDYYAKKKIASQAAGVDTSYADEQYQIAHQWDGAPKKATGLERIPYNGFPIIAHKDETLLNKTEADARRSGKIGVGSDRVLVTGNTFYVRQESDIDTIALKLARELYRQEGAMAQ